MPIKPEKKVLYPANWSEVRKRILARAGGHCEKCYAPDRSRIARGAGDDAGTYMLDTGFVYDDTTGDGLGMCRHSDYNVGRMVDVVLTIAHLHDPNPANCADDNLAALCQQCHNRLDAPLRAANARQTRRSRKAIGELF